MTNCDSECGEEYAMGVALLMSQGTGDIGQVGWAPQYHGTMSVAYMTSEDE